MKFIHMTSMTLAFLGLAACSSNEPELPPAPPGSVLTTVTANSRDRDINGLSARDPFAPTTVEACEEAGQVRDADGVCG